MKKAGLNDTNIFSEASHSQIIKAFIQTDTDLNKNGNIGTDTSGSTCVSVIMVRDQMICANLGDSCAAQVCCQDETWTLEMLNREHKPCEKDERDRVESCNGRVEPFRG